MDEPKVYYARLPGQYGSVRITTSRVRAGDLRPGDLFSTAGPLWWATHDDTAVGEKLYMRTDNPGPAGQEDEMVTKVEIERIP